ncbi:MAG TPA: 16S rRNA (cytosine(1402)-N(4))-methyltransferase RsmH [Candidatus Dormibacteraeota bacterium]|nr:16S rRNA (cytosine(1402)-N(4))-methyltransferase RsmH [Candidatus Dormibacteraeota bacterium]
MSADPPPVHVPVLLRQVLEALAPRPGGRYVDATANGGGHLRAVLDACAPDGRLLGIDRDPEILTALTATCAAAIDTGRLQLVAGSFAALSRLLAAHHFAPVDGILFDLGLSSFHLDVSGRGFTYLRDEPLDMRFDPTDDASESAADILATRDADELAAIFRDYGEERFASRIARTIVARRREQAITTSGQLLAAIEQSLPPATRWRAARDAARIFQALRIAANDELEQVAEVLPQAVAALAPGGRLAVIAFHSLEDRMVKHFLRDQAAAGRLRLLRRKPIIADADEIAANPRAASAKLRAAEKI